MATLSPENVASLRAQLWESGFRPVPIVNWDAAGLSPGKRPLGKDWRLDALKDPPYCTTIPAVPFALNTGVLCDKLRPIDIDIDDVAIAHRIRAMALDRWGEAPIRMRKNSPRCTLLYRAAVGAPTKLAVTGASHRPGASLKVEVLGAGQQFVAFGRHETDIDLEWFPEAPGEITADSLTAITEEEVSQFLNAVAEVIGAEPPAKPNGKDHYAASEPQADPLRLAAAMASISNGGASDWEAWNKVGMALWRATGGSVIGGELWNEWSKRNGSYDYNHTLERWNHYRRSPPTEVGAGTLFHMAGGTFHPEQEMEEPPPSDPFDPGWDPSFSQHLVDFQGPAEVHGDEEPSSDKPPPDLGDGKIIAPAQHWTAPAPLRQWLIQDWIPLGYVTAIYGDGGVGKSLIAQQLLSSVALGLPWLGLSVRAGRAFGMMCEDDASELHRRQESINSAYGVVMSHLENLRISARLGSDNLLMTFDQENHGKPTGLYAELITYLEEYRPRIVVLDTLADIFGGNEINRTHARQFVQGVGGNIARKYECAVVIPAHPSASGLSTGSGTSGSTAWNNTFRSRLYITRPDKDEASDTRLISRMKSNYAPKGGEITASWERGAFVNVNAPKVAVGIGWPEIEIIFREIDARWKAKDPLSSEPQTRNHGRYAGLVLAIITGVSERVIARAIQGWLASGHLKRDLADTKAKTWGLRVAKWLQPEVSK